MLQHEERPAPRKYNAQQYQRNSDQTTRSRPSTALGQNTVFKRGPTLGTSWLNQPLDTVQALRTGRGTDAHEAPQPCTYPDEQSRRNDVPKAPQPCT